MRRLLYIGALLLTAACTFTTASAQQADAMQQKRIQHGFYRRSLGVDSAKADQVSKVQEAYKADLKSLMADTSIGIEGRRAKMRSLIYAKNQKLGQLLSPAQLAKMVPTTERVPSKSKQ